MQFFAEITCIPRPPPAQLRQPGTQSGHQCWLLLSCCSKGSWNKRCMWTKMYEFVFHCFRHISDFRFEPYNIGLSFKSPSLFASNWIIGHYFPHGLRKLRFGSDSRSIFSDFDLVDEATFKNCDLTFLIFSLLLLSFLDTYQLALAQLFFLESGLNSQI